jgi:hypothetical protein
MDIIFGTTISLIIMIAVAVVLFEFRIHQPDTLRALPGTSACASN